MSSSASANYPQSERGRLRHQQRPRRTDDKRRVHRRRFCAPREDRGMAHASIHAPGVKPRRHQDLRPKKPPEQQQPPPPEPRAARRCPPHPRNTAGQQIDDAHASHINTSRAICREPTGPQRGPRAVPRFHLAMTTSEQHVSMPDPFNHPSRTLNMQPTVLTRHC